jgi:hypothetical protein
MADAKKDETGGSFNDIAAFMQKMWNPFGVSVPGFGVPGAWAGAPGIGPGIAGGAGGVPFPNPAAMFATLDPAELERKINELKTIESWLQMSLNLMQLSIKTMELQKASLEALRGAHAPAADKAAPDEVAPGKPEPGKSASPGRKS